MREFRQMLRKLFGGGFGVLAAIVHRIGKQKVFAGDDNDKSQEETTFPAHRTKKGKFAKKKEIEKRQHFQQLIPQGRAVPRRQFDCPTNIPWTRAQETQEVRAKFVYTFYPMSTTTIKYLTFCTMFHSLYNSY